MLRRNLLILSGVAAASTVLTACGSSDDHVAAAPAQDIVQLAQATPALSILLAMAQTLLFWVFTQARIGLRGAL